MTAEEPLAAVNEPHSLDLAVSALMRAGLLTARCGAAAFRVRKVMERAAHSLGITCTQINATPDAIYATVCNSGMTHTQVVRVAEYGVNMWRLRAIDLLSRELERAPLGSVSVQELEDHLATIEREPASFPRWLTVPVLGGSCAAFCGVIGGSAYQMLAAFLGTALGHVIRLQLLKRHVPVVTLVVTCAFAACAGAYAAILGLNWIRSLFHVAALAGDKAVLSSVLYLVPGVPLVTGLLDITHNDCAAGLSRTAHAGLVVVSIGAGVLMFFSLLGRGV